VFEKQTGISTMVAIKGDPVRVTGQTATHCFRIVQEALTNAAKHSKTKSAEVEMVFSKNTLTINVHDFGNGMPQAKKGVRPGLGFIAMRERAEILGGALSTSSTPGAGTTVSLTMPLQQEDQIDIAETENLREALTGKS
jgi:signal transduction histidine kinase